VAITRALLKPLDFFVLRFYLSDEDCPRHPAIWNRLKKGNAMKVAEEFSVKSTAGKTLPLQYVTPQLTYLDFGSVRLPRGFEGYRVKDSARVAQKLDDGGFKIDGEVYYRV
jgi:hypothetical protein